MLSGMLIPLVMFIFLYASTLLSRGKMNMAVFLSIS